MTRAASTPCIRIRTLDLDDGPRYPTCLHPLSRDRPQATLLATPAPSGAIPLVLLMLELSNPFDVSFAQRRAVGGHVLISGATVRDGDGTSASPLGSARRPGEGHGAGARGPASRLRLLWWVLPGRRETDGLRPHGRGIF